jgi:hypothetical protein
MKLRFEYTDHYGTEGAVERTIMDGCEIDEIADFFTLALQSLTFDGAVATCAYPTPDEED